MSNKEIENRFKEEIKHSIIEVNSFTIKEVVEQFKKPKYIIPDYQRNQVWKEEKSSLLIESLIMNLPLPTIFLFEKKENEYEVIDGQQRLAAIKDFYNNKYQLKKLDFWGDALNGKYYKDLPDIMKNHLSTRMIKVTNLITDSKAEEKDIQRILFERLNTGGVKLVEQEIRNAVYSGNLNDLLKELSKNKLFLKMLPVTDEQKKKMKNRENVLRFLTYLEKKSITKESMNKYMSSNKNLSDTKIGELKDNFISTLKLIKAILGEDAFKEVDAKGKMQLKYIKYDVYMNIFSSLKEKIKESHYEEIKKIKSDIFKGKTTKVTEINNLIDEINPKIISILGEDSLCSI